MIMHRYMNKGNRNFLNRYPVLLYLLDIYVVLDLE